MNFIPPSVCNACVPICMFSAVLADETVRLDLCEAPSLTSDDLEDTGDVILTVVAIERDRATLGGLGCPSVVGSPIV